MNEIVPDIFTWVWFSEPHGYNFNGHLVRHPAGNLCIDPVPPDERGPCRNRADGRHQDSPHQS